MLIFLISNDLDYNQIIAKWIISHKVICNIQDCPICTNIVETFGKIIPSKVNIQKFFTFVVDVIDKEIAKGNLKLTPEEKIYLDIIRLYNMQFRNETQRLKYYLASYQAILKYRASNTTIYYNILVMFERNMEDNEEFNKIYDGFKVSEDAFVLYNKFFDDIDNFMRYQNKNPGNIIKISDKLYQFAKNKLILNLIKNSSTMTYENLILRYVFENVAAKSLKGNYEFLDLTNYDDYLDYHFKNDNFLLIHYGLVAKDCTIIKSSSDFRRYLNFCLDSLFPKALRQFGKERFITSINTNDFRDDLNIFEYVVTNLKNMGTGYIESFFMKYVMFPSIDSGEVLINGHFLLGSKEAIIFKKIEGKKEILVSFSENFGKVIKIDPEIVANLSAAQKFFTYDGLFNKISTESKKISNQGNVNRQNSKKTIKTLESMDEDDYNALSLDQQLKRDRLIAAEKQKKMERESEMTATLHYKHYLTTLQDYFVDNNDIKNKDKIIEELKTNKQQK